MEPLRYEVKGAGKIEARTTPQGKLKVMLEAEDDAALLKLWRSLRKRMTSG